MSLYTSQQIWLLSMLAVHLACMGGSLYLIRGAPCWMVQVFQGGVAIGSMFFSLGFYLEMQGSWLATYAMEAAYSFEHTAVLFLVLRQIFWPKGMKQLWISSSQPSHSS